MIRQARGWGRNDDGSYLFSPSKKEREEVPSTLLDIVEQARGDWLAAMAFFDMVTEPDQVDQAVFQLEAAERRYMYLMKKAREAEASRTVSLR